ncbi:MAG: hypothetical protein HY854_05955 [Burkholderiales bacterium]|nr:hypothetical protein [Burkholderiales bacterium]
MARNERNSGRNGPEYRTRTTQLRDSGPRKQQGGSIGRAGASEPGHGGYGSESVRPYLRAQLRLKELMARSGNLFPDPWDEERLAPKK